MMSGEDFPSESDRIARLFGLIAVRAGEAIMRLRATVRDPQYELDGSPATIADLGADEIIRVDYQKEVFDRTSATMSPLPQVLGSLPSHRPPYRAEREMVRSLVGGAEFIEVFVDPHRGMRQARSEEPPFRWTTARAWLLGFNQEE